MTTVKIHTVEGEEIEFQNVKSMSRGADVTLITGEGYEVQFFNEYIVFIQKLEEVKE